GEAPPRARPGGADGSRRPRRPVPLSPAGYLARGDVRPVVPVGPREALRPAAPSTLPPPASRGRSPQRGDTAATRGDAPRVTGYGSLSRQTAPALLVERARRTPECVAYRAKELGIYRETTWRELARQVAAVALGLEARGLAAGDRVAIMAHTCPEWT